MIENEWQLSKRCIKNRIIVPPMGTFGYGLPNNTVSVKHLTHYRQIAEGGAGLLTVEACGVSSGLSHTRDVIGLWDDVFLPGLAKLAVCAKANETVACVQLFHQGAQALGYPSADFLDERKIDEIMGDFISAAMRCKKAGFDGVELHGAHGFFLNQLLTIGRVDRVGRLIERIKEFGSTFIVGIRIGCNEPDIFGGVKNAIALERFGADYLSISRGMGSTIRVPDHFLYGDLVYGASLIKRETSIPVFAVKGVRRTEQAEAIVRHGYSDAVCVGRSILADPQWYNKCMKGEEPIACLNCCFCQWHKNGDFCPVRKLVRDEKEEQIEKTNLLRPEPDRKFLEGGGSPLLRSTHRG